MQAASALVNAVHEPWIGPRPDAVAVVSCVPESPATVKLTTREPFWLFVAFCVRRAKWVNDVLAGIVNVLPSTVHPSRLMTVTLPRSVPFKVAPVIVTVTGLFVVFEAAILKT
jgi:hypothetical protein